MLSGQRPLDRHPLVVVTNREPYIDERVGQGIRTVQSAGGVVAALDPLLQEHGGYWVAWGSGSADFQAAPDGRRQVPPRNPRYTLCRVALSPEEVEGYYASYSNQGLWPLSHLLIERAHFSREAYGFYAAVNRKFAQAAARVAPRRAWVFSHDYQLALFPAALKRARPDLTIAHFWHIPWAPFTVFRLCPHYRALLEGLLGADVLGFQTGGDVFHFLNAVQRTFPEAVVDRELGVVTWNRHTTRVSAFPVSVDYAAIRELALSRRVSRMARGLRRQLAHADLQLVVAVDRADYTKGILHRLEALADFLERYPAWHRRFVLLQVVVPTRTEVDEYRDLFTEVLRRTRALNEEWGRDGWQPVVTIRRSLDRARLTALFRAADVALVSSLFDGMNLVAKEFVAAQVDRRGVLLVSESAGASEELTDAFPVNPLDPEGMAATLDEALRLPPAERAARLGRMQAYLSRHNVYTWLQDILDALEEASLNPSWLTTDAETSPSLIGESWTDS
ncbi:Trehalose-6-phosphate synthase [Candidatus Hydrogenisulfobacillus filiaventi]|uniref:Trehalose-6-phosphate synthase n=1 Tax=Candidatus Hydrogenisulfobacillus filiaventi TaxID=2707344 RepID=A0A6F8ZGQ4_9FIRM|nr:trehalose-6-phosphate synthase [Bacillota bacterium]CAB1129067.1 Trehalose-6-phosphate synthase [Candidatus Hydrogenisulfobacillus filiaventi]